jgi:hypothetical protein
MKQIQAATQAAELIAHVRGALEDVAEAEGEVAGDVVDWVIDRVISALRTDSSIPERTRPHWEAFFSDASDKAAYDLRRLNGLISRRQAIWAIEDFFIDFAPPVDEVATQASEEA